MLDPVGVQVLQLDLIVVQQTLEEQVGRNHESMLMEGREGDDVAIGRCRRIPTAGHEPLHHIGPPTEKTTLMRPSMHAWVTLERYHKSMEEGCSSREVEAIDLGLRRWISSHGRSEWRRWRNREGKVAVLLCRDMKGKASIYKAERGEKENRSPRFTHPLRHDMTPPSKDHVHTISGHALKGHAR